MIPSNHKSTYKKTSFGLLGFLVVQIVSEKTHKIHVTFYRVFMGIMVIILLILILLLKYETLLLIKITQE